MPSVLKEKAVKGVSWTLVETFGLQGIKFVLGIILARLLTPKDYGLIGMIAVFFAVARVFINSGFGAAYIQKKEVTDIDANTVFFSNLGISLILYCILWLAAPAIAGFYEQGALIQLTKVMGLVVIINAFNVIQISQVTRNLDFKRKTKITLIATVISGIMGVTAALYNFGVWSLVIQQLASRLLTTVGLWITNKWNPTLRFSKESFKNLFSFGVWFLGSNIIKTAFDNIYLVFIGKFFPAAQLGFFTKSKQFQSLASEQISGAIGRVSFPIFSQMQDNKKRLENSLSKILRHTIIFIVPILVTLIVVSKPFVILLLTDKWAPMIPFLQLFCIIGFFYPIQNINNQLIYSLGKSQINFRISLIKNILRIANIIFMYRFGVNYIILGEIIVSFLTLFIIIYYTRMLINYGIIKQWNDIKQIFFGGVLAGIFGYLISLNFDNLLFMLIAGVLTTISVYVLTQYIFNRKLFFEILSLSNLVFDKS